MKVREKETGRTGWGFKLHGMGEVVVGFDDNDCTSVFAHDLEVFLESSQEWVVFGDKRIVTKNNTDFREARTQEEVQRGYYL